MNAMEQGYGHRAKQAKKNGSRFRSNAQNGAINRFCIAGVAAERIETAQTTFSASMEETAPAIFVSLGSENATTGIFRSMSDAGVMQPLSAPEEEPAEKDIKFAMALESCKAEPVDEADRESKWAHVTTYTKDVSTLRESMEQATLAKIDDESMEGTVESGYWIGYDLAIESAKVAAKMLGVRDAQKAQAIAHNDTTCPICQEDFNSDVEVVVTTCRHAFCADCLDQWKGHGGRKCPLCNFSLVNGADTLPPMDYDNSMENEPVYISLGRDAPQPRYALLSAEEDDPNPAPQPRFAVLSTEEDDPNPAPQPRFAATSPNNVEHADHTDHADYVMRDVVCAGHVSGGGPLSMTEEGENQYCSLGCSHA